MKGYIDIALTGEESAELYSTSPLVADMPRYPYGTSISLDEKLLDKLDVDHTDWKIGDTIPLDVLVKVTSINSNQTQENGERICVTFQIIGMKGEEVPEEIEEAEKFEEEADLKPHGYMRYGK